MSETSDGVAWREFEACYGPLILGYCRRRGLQLTDAEDVRQMVLSDLSKSLPTFDFQPAKGRFRTYLGRVVTNAVSRHLRRHKPPDRALDTSVLATTPGTHRNEVDQAWEQEWIKHHYRLALDVLRRRGAADGAV